MLVGDHFGIIHAINACTPNKFPVSHSPPASPKLEVRVTPLLCGGSTHGPWLAHIHQCKVCSCFLKMHCHEPIERLYYATNFDDICIYWAAKASPWLNKELYYPQCKDCVDKAKDSKCKEELTVVHCVFCQVYTRF